MIFVTGGTGWLGKTAVHYLIGRLDEKEFKKNVKVFGSKDKEIFIKNRKINVLSLNKIKKFQDPNKSFNIFHTAFLTKDKLKLLGIDDYKKNNLKIINCIEDFISNNPKSRIVCCSSGEVNNFLSQKDKTHNVYGYLKYLEENRLSKYGNCLKLRIYALTGYYINSPEIYALCNFIHSALNKKNININSEGIVYRSYVSAEIIVETSFKWLFSDQLGQTFNATTEKIDLLTLAKNLSEIIGDITIKHKLQNKKIVSDYSADNYAFTKFLEKNNVKKQSITKQLKTSIEGYSRLIK